MAPLRSGPRSNVGLGRDVVDGHGPGEPDRDAVLGRGEAERLVDPPRIGHMRDLWLVSGRTSLPGSGGAAREDAALMTILDGLGTRKMQRDIAVEIWGGERVAAEWTTGYWMRPQVRRRIDKAEALDVGAWRSLLPPADPDD